METFLGQLSREQFQDLYDNSAPDIKKRCSSGSFVAQLSDLMTEARRIQPDLQWQKNYYLVESEGVKRLDNSNLIFAHRELVDENKNQLSLSAYWTDEYGPVQLSGISVQVSTNGVSKPKGGLCADSETLPIR